MAEDDKNVGSRRPKRARARFPLLLKLFLLMALVIGTVVAAAMVVTIRRAEAVANTTVNRAISGAGRLYKDLEQSRLRLLSLGASSVGRDVNFVAYLQDALQQSRGDQPDAESADYVPPSIDTISILDQIDQRRQALNSDLVILTDDQGYQLARTDESVSASSGAVDLYESMPLLKFAIDEAPDDPATGVVTTKGRLFHAAIAPIGVGPSGVVVGYIINARAIDQKFADQVAETTRTSVAFLPSGTESEVEIPRSTNAPNAESFRAMEEIGQVAKTGTMSPPHNATIDGGEYLLTAEPLTAADEVRAVAVFVRSLDAELAPFREIERTLVYAGIVALVLAFLLSGLVASRVTRPISTLAAAAQAVADGDLSVTPRIETSDEVGILSGAFSKMISSLRDKRELEQLYEQMASRSESAPARPELSAPESKESTIMVTDLRGLSSVLGPDKTVALMGEVFRMQENEIGRQDGSLVAVTGHQLTASFGGDRGVVHAVRAARAIGENLAAMTREMELSVAVGIASGEFITGGVRTEEISTNTLSGDTPLLATLFAWEAPSGSMFISRASAQQAGNDFLSTAVPEQIELRWLPAPLTVAHVPLVGVTTGMIQPVTHSGTSELTLRLDSDATPVAVLRDLQPGMVFASRYRIESILGRGGMGVVYKATDLQLDEVVAIKTLPQQSIDSSAEDVERFKREIRVARKITHRNVLRTFDYGEADGWYFISMEYVRGYTLADLLDQTSQLTVRSVLGVMRQISRGLEAAHEQGVIHRDIKPQNVLIDHKGEVRLMDFGIARAQEAEAMTRQGVIVGTPHYMSPEQVQSRTLDSRSDVYSMGVMMYEMLCGRRPFNSMSLTAVLTAHVTEDAVPPIRLRAEIGSELNAIVMKCLTKKPAERYADGGALLEALNKVQMEPAAKAGA